MSLDGIFPIDDWNFKIPSLLENLTPTDLSALTHNRKETIYKKGQIIFFEKAAARGVYLLLQGKVKKYKEDNAGKQKLIYVASTGELLGYHAVLSGKRYNDSAAALEESTVAFIPSDQFLLVVNQSPTLSFRLLQFLAHEFTVLTNNLTLFGSMFVKERLALHLLLLREKYKLDNDWGKPVDINISREDLASLVGTARENVIRLLTEFKEQGLVKTYGATITILDIQQLIKLAQNK